MFAQKSFYMWLSGLALASAVCADDGPRIASLKKPFESQAANAPAATALKALPTVPLARQRRERRKQWETVLQSPAGLVTGHPENMTLGKLLDQIREKHGLNVQIDLPHVLSMIKAFESGGSGGHTAGVAGFFPFGVGYQAHAPIGQSPSVLEPEASSPWIRSTPAGVPAYYPVAPATALTPPSNPIAPASAAPTYDAAPPAFTPALETSEQFDNEAPERDASNEETDRSVSDLGRKRIQVRNRQAEARDDSSRDIPGAAGDRTNAWDPLIQQAVSSLLGRHKTESDDVPSGKRVCFVGLENKSNEDLGDVGEEIGDKIDASISESNGFELISRRFVQAGLRESGLRPDDLLIPKNARAFGASLKKMDQPFDYLLIATVTSGTIRRDNDLQRDNALTLELVDMADGQVDKERAELRQGYLKVSPTKPKPPRPRKPKKQNPASEPETKAVKPSGEASHPFAEVLKSILDSPVDPAVLAQPNVTVEDVLRQSFERAVPMQAMMNASLSEEMPLLASLTKAAEWELLVQDNGVLVTTKLNANLQKETRVYSIRELEQLSKLKPEEVARVITRTVRPWSWKRYYPDAETADSAPATKKPRGSAKKVSIPNINLDLLSLLLSSNNDGLAAQRIRLTSDDDSPDESNAHSSEKFELTEEDLEMLGRAWEGLFLATVTSIQVIYHSDPPTGVVEVLPGMLIISQSQGAHREIADLLEQLAHPDN